MGIWSDFEMDLTISDLSNYLLESRKDEKEQ